MIQTIAREDECARRDHNRRVRRLVLPLAFASRDRYATSLCRNIAEAARQIMQAPGRKLWLCPCCPRAIRKLDRMTFGLAVLHVDDPSAALSFAVCVRSAASPNAAEKVLGSLRRLWPDLLQITVHAEGARA